jgi:hypothetical protein
MKYIQTLEAKPNRGSGPFPIDMLRYDNCSPAREVDSSEIASTFALQRVSEPAPVQLKRYTAKQAEHPTYQRWDSFGWHVEVLAVRKA